MLPAATGLVLADPGAGLVEPGLVDAPLGVPALEDLQRRLPGGQARRRRGAPQVTAERQARDGDHGDPDHQTEGHHPAHPATEAVHHRNRLLLLSRLTLGRPDHDGRWDREQVPKVPPATGRHGRRPSCCWSAPAVAVASAGAWWW